AIVGPERMGRELLDKASALYTPYLRATDEYCERTGQPGAERICGVAPKVAGVVGAIDLLDEIEALHRRSLLRVVRQAAQEARQGKPDVAAVLRVTERLPLGVLDGVEHLGQVARLAQFGEALDAEHFRGCGGDERRMRSGGHVRHLLDEVHVLRLASDLVVTDQSPKGRATESPELLLVDLFEQRALVEVDRRLEVLDHV